MTSSCSDIGESFPGIDLPISGKNMPMNEKKLTNISWLFYLPISVNHLVFRCEGMIHRYPEIKIDSNIGKWFTVSLISFPDIGMPIYLNQRMSWFTNMGKSKWSTDIDSSIKIQIERGKTMSMEKGVHWYLVKLTTIWVSPNTTGTIRLQNLDNRYRISELRI